MGLNGEEGAIEAQREDQRGVDGVTEGCHTHGEEGITWDLIQTSLVKEDTQHITNLSVVFHTIRVMLFQNMA